MGDWAELVCLTLTKAEALCFEQRLRYIELTGAGVAGRGLHRKVEGPTGHASFVIEFMDGA